MIKEVSSKLKQLFTDRKRAYSFTFNLKDQADLLVLKDLAKFCRAHETTFHTDERVAAVLEGRREVWLRIQNHLNLTTDEIYDLHTVKNKGE